MELTSRELASLVAPAFPGAQLERQELLTTGLANTNVRFWLRGHAGSYVLRLHTRDPSSAARESALMPYLAQRAPSVPVPELVYTQGSPAPLSIWRFVEGELLQDVFKTASDDALLQIAEACGHTLAGLADCRFERCGELAPDLSISHEYGAPSEFVPAVIHTGLAGLPGERLGPELSRQLSETLERTQPLLRELDGTYTLVHADFKRSNLLLAREAAGYRVAAVLDWEFACAGPPIIDVGLFLRAGRALPARFREAFVNGYRAAGGHLPDEWLRLSRLVDLVSQITFLDGAEERPRVWAETKRVIEETVEALERG